MDPNTFEEKELDILRKAVDVVEKKKGKNVMNDPEIQKIIGIVERFIISKKLVCYGGTAINNILPSEDQFYDKDIELPDYDFYSPNALKDAKELADIYYDAGYEEVEAKAGVHMGTYKVFVNFMGIADITQMEPTLFKTIKKSSINVKGVMYAPPNFLRMAMYLELSRPNGDVSRWEKVQKRLILLNKNYPLKGEKCGDHEVQRNLENDADGNGEELYDIVRETFIRNKLVFLGGYANVLYSRYMPRKQRRIVEKIPDFDMLAEDPEQICQIVASDLKARGFSKIKIIQHTGVGEVISRHNEIRVNNETIAFVYKPLACHSYNAIKVDGETMRVATIDTMLSFYLAFIYADRPYYDESRLLCMSQFLFDVQQRNRLKQKGLLKRFSLECYGNQETLDDMREEKAEKYIELKNKKETNEYEQWFLRYLPGDLRSNKHTPKKRSKPLRSKPLSRSKTLKLSSNKKSSKKSSKSKSTTMKK